MYSYAHIGIPNTLYTWKTLESLSLFFGVKRYSQRYPTSCSKPVFKVLSKCPIHIF